MMVCTQPDISYFVNVVCRYKANPGNWEDTFGGCKMDTSLFEKDCGCLFNVRKKTIAD